MESDFGLEIHHRLLAGDPIATSELAEAYLERLIRRLHGIYPDIRDETLLWDAAVDAVLNYARSPSRFNPEKSQLLTYLTMSAKGDLLNSLARSERRGKREVLVDDVEEAVAAGKRSHGGGSTMPTQEPPSSEDTSVQNLRERAFEVITNDLDRQLLNLILDEERRTSAYSAVLGIQQMTEAEQRTLVKRHKDRLDKRLKRLGRRLREQGYEY